MCQKINISARILVCYSFCTPSRLLRSLTFSTPLAPVYLPPPLLILYRRQPLYDSCIALFRDSPGFFFFLFAARFLSEGRLWLLFSTPPPPHPVVAFSDSRRASLSKGDFSIRVPAPRSADLRSAAPICCSRSPYTLFLGCWGVGGREGFLESGRGN